MAQVSSSETTKQEPLLQRQPSRYVEFDSVKELVFRFYFPSALQQLTRGLPISVVPLWMLDNGFNAGNVGVMVAIGGFGAMLINVPAGMIISKFGPKVSLMFFHFLHGLGATILLISYYTPKLFGHGPFMNGDLLPLIVGYGLILVGGSATDVSRLAFLAATCHPDLRARAVTYVSGQLRFMWSLAPVLAGVTAAHLGIHYVYMLQITLISVSLVVFLFFLPNVDPNQRHNARAPKKHTSMFETFRRYWKPLLIVTVFSSLLGICRRSRELMFPLTGKHLELTQEQVGSLQSVSWIIDAGLVGVAAYLTDKLGRTKTGFLSSACFCLAFATLVPGQFWGMITFSLISGFANGISSGLINVIGTDLAPSDCRGEFLGLFKGLGKVSDMLAPAVVGGFTHAFSLESAQSMVSVLALLAGVWVSTMVPETKPAEPDVESLRKTKHHGVADLN